MPVPASFGGLSPVHPCFSWTSLEAQVWTQPSSGGLASAEGKDHLASPAGNTLSKAAQDTVGLLSSRVTLLINVQLGVHQDLFCRAAFQLCAPQHVLVPGAVPLRTSPH